MYPVYWSHFLSFPVFHVYYMYVETVPASADFYSELWRKILWDGLQGQDLSYIPGKNSGLRSLNTFIPLKAQHSSRLQPRHSVYD